MTVFPKLAFALRTLPAALLFAAILPVTASAQEPSSPLSGIVVDTTAALVAGARVTLDGKTVRTADSGGRFTFPCVRPGAHTLLAHATGFADSSTRTFAPHDPALSLRLVPSTESSVNVDADDSDMQVPSPGGANGVVISGKQLDALADDPDDLLRELQQLAAASGGSPGSTIISVDGFQDSARLPPKDSIAFINVSPDLFAAEYREPPFGGGRVEVYTKPGAKTYHGALFTTQSSSWLNARDPFSTDRGTVGKQRYGFDLSGPIRRQGSNFTMSLEHRSIDELGVVNAVTLNAAGDTVNVIDNVPQPQRLWIGSARADWQFGPKDFAFVTYTANVNSLANMGVGGSVLRETGYTDSDNDQTVRFSNVTTFTPRLMHEARVSFEWEHENDLPNSTAPNITVSGFFTGGGANLGSTRNFHSRMEYDDDVVITPKNHSIKAGWQLFYLHRNSQILTNFNGAYVFANSAEYLAGTPEEFNGVTGNPNVRVDQVRFAAFYQDSWKVRDNLSLSYGLRYFLETDPATFSNVDPRAGLAWTLDKKKTLTFSAHFGIFHGQFDADDAQELHREDGVQRITSLVYNPVYGSPLTGATPIHAERTLLPGTSPGTFVFGEVSLSKDLPFGFNLNVQYVPLRFLNYDRTVNVNQPLDSNPYGVRPLTPNLNILQLNDSGTGQGHGEFFGLSNFKQKHVQFFFGALHLNIRDDAGDGIFQQPQSAYTDAGEVVRRDRQGLWQMFGNASVSLPYKLSFSMNGYAQGGQPFNILTGADNNGDGDFNDRPQFAAPGATADYKTVFPTPFGLLTNAGPIVNGIPLRPIQRNLGELPWSFHLDANLQRAFVLTRDKKAEHKQTLTANIRSANFLNHTNVTAEGNVLGSPQFLLPVAADTGRRVEAGLRYSF